MRISLYKPESRNTSNWAHGTTTELFIYPARASFQERNFLFRISTATVEAEACDFTYFEGISRQLMVLTGHLLLTHEGHYEKALGPYDQDSFSGTWKTRCQGKATDFNLMLREGTQGSIHAIQLPAGVTHRIHSPCDYCLIYLIEGRAALQDNTSIGPRDLLNLPKTEALTLKAEDDCHFVITEVMLPGS